MCSYSKNIRTVNKEKEKARSYQDSYAYMECVIILFCINKNTHLKFSLYHLLFLIKQNSTNLGSRKKTIVIF
jgi:hypothetical protein